MLNEAKPFFTLFVSTVVGFLVAHGTLDQSSSAGATQSLNDLIGGVILIATAIVALDRYVTKHPISTVKPVGDVPVQNPPVVTPTVDTVVTQSAPVDVPAVG